MVLPIYQHNSLVLSLTKVSLVYCETEQLYVKTSRWLWSIRNCDCEASLLCVVCDLSFIFSCLFIWRFPKSYGHPQSSSTLIVFSIIKHPAIGLPPWRAGNPHVIDISMHIHVAIIVFSQLTCKQQEWAGHHQKELSSFLLNLLYVGW